MVTSTVSMSVLWATLIHCVRVEVSEPVVSSFIPLPFKRVTKHFYPDILV